MVGSVRNVSAHSETKALLVGSVSRMEGELKAEERESHGGVPSSAEAMDVARATITIAVQSFILISN